MILRGTHTRRDVIKAGGAAVVGASALGVFPRLAMPPSAAAAAFTGITLDLSTTDLAGQGYESEGTQPFSIDTVAQRLAIGDFSSTDHRAFRKAVPELTPPYLGGVPQEVTVEVLVVIDPGSVTPSGDDTGVHAVLSEGRGGREVRAVCVRRGSERRLALKLDGDVQSVGFPFDWGFESTFRLTRLANGDGVIEANGLSEHIGTGDFPSSSGQTASFALGCFVRSATALATFGPIGVPAGSPFAATVQPPIDPDGSSKFNASKGVIPVKFSLTSNGSPTCDLPPATLRLSRTGGTSPGAIDEAVYTGPSDSGSQFRIADCQYHYNVKASALGPGAYLTEILIDGAVVGEARFELK